jgi:hypothetical protein
MMPTILFDGIQEEQHGLHIFHPFLGANHASTDTPLKVNGTI